MPEESVDLDESPVIEEIEGLIRVYKDGHVTRTQIVPCVSSSLPADLNVISNDVVIDKGSSLWARLYVPTSEEKLPLLVYFHGGGFSVGSASWSCYHRFLSNLSAKSGCVILSVNYRLSPENPLPAPYEDGLVTLFWLKEQALNLSQPWWSKNCDFDNVFLVGDSAGANIAYNATNKLDLSHSYQQLKPLTIKGRILIQPFFGGEGRTGSEKYMIQPPTSALSLSASDTYWRLALPSGATRDHPWCNPLASGLVGVKKKKALPTFVCVSEMDILKDRNLEFLGALAKVGNRVEYVVYNGVGHAFQILSNSPISQARSREMVSHIKEFVCRYRL